jgi:hypothetical protein
MLRMFLLPPVFFPTFKLIDIAAMILLHLFRAFRFLPEFATV